MSAMRRSPRWTDMAPPSYTVSGPRWASPTHARRLLPHRLFRLEPVGELLEAALCRAHPEPVLLGLVVRADGERWQDPALPTLDGLEGGDQRLARQVPARARGAFREEH